MKVKDILEILQREDPEAEVVLEFHTDSDMSPFEEKDIKVYEQNGVVYLSDQN